MNLKSIASQFFLLALLAGGSSARADVGPGREMDEVQLDFKLTPRDAWAASAVITITARETREDMDIVLLSTGVVNVDGVPAGWVKTPFSGEPDFGYPPRTRFVGHLPRLEPGSSHLYGLPLSVNVAGLGEVMVTLVRRGNPFARGVSVTRAVVATGQDLHVGSSLFQLRLTLLRERLRQKGLTPAEIEKEIEHFSRGGAVTSASFRR